MLQITGGIRWLLGGVGFKGRRGRGVGKGREWEIGDIWALQLFFTGITWE